MNDFEPESVPIRQAATVMLIDDRPDLQVFMMERHANTIFAGGMWVFPGGAVDHQDDAGYYTDIATHRTDEEASQLMDLDAGGIAYYMAAIRETFEEAGILLALHKEDESPLIIAEDNAHMKIMSVGEAVMQMDLSGAPVIIFKTEENGAVNVVYRRDDGNVGWVDAKA